jgi:GNAT superfamily N-acetyltransferase
MKIRDVEWRGMTWFDLASVSSVAKQVHPGFFETDAVLAEKRALYPNGAYLLELSGRPVGYVLSHPWRKNTVPQLNQMLGAIPDTADTFYLHDLALLPAVRRIGAAGYIIEALSKHAQVKGFAEMSLVAVNNSVPFWERHGFAVVEVPALAETLGGYEAAARYMVKALG